MFERPKRLDNEFPNEIQGFLKFLKEAESGAALPVKDKELINTAVAVAALCEWCIAFHQQKNSQNRRHTARARRGRFSGGSDMHGNPAFM
jgi:alkylhydroperoxidase/carboxymuconolactone decarboxylase family protein YurZ